MRTSQTEYNLALSCLSGEYSDYLHKTILKKHPLFTSPCCPWVRSRNRRSVLRRLEWYEKAQEAAKNQVFEEENFGLETRRASSRHGSTIKLGNLFYRLARKNRSQTYMTRALEVFKSVVRIDREDAYSRVAMGILEYERLPDPYVVFERSVRARSARITIISLASLSELLEYITTRM